VASRCPSRCHQPFDLGFGEVLAGPQVAVGGAAWAQLFVLGDWRDQLEV
jgi:hypothetical protein